MQHDVKRTYGTPEEEAAKKEEISKKIKAYKILFEKVNKKRTMNEMDEEAIALTKRILRINPELYTMWNFRRKIILLMLEQKKAEEDPTLEDSVSKKMLLEEVFLTEESVSRFPKSYWIWSHRWWAVELLSTTYSSSPDDAFKVLEREIMLTVKFLKRDSRNFHCWNYRRDIRRVIAKRSEDKGIKPEDLLKDELDFTTTLINTNFSNYSAWHQRSLILPLLYTGDEYAKAIDEELELVKQAFYTEPEDQSAWLYHRWLISQNHTEDIINRELNACEELLSVEPNTKWALLTKAFLIKEHLKIKSEGGDSSCSDKESQLSDTLSLLGKVDPMHSSMYNEMQKGEAFAA